jgi:hypothetical protein
MVSAMGAYPTAAVNQFEMEQECAHADQPAPKAKAPAKPSDKRTWLEKRGYHDSFGHDDEQGKADPKEDAPLSTTSPSSRCDDEARQYPAPS